MSRATDLDSEYSDEFKDDFLEMTEGHELEHEGKAHSPHIPTWNQPGFVTHERLAFFEALSDSNAPQLRLERLINNNEQDHRQWLLSTNQYFQSELDELNLRCSRVQGRLDDEREKLTGLIGDKDNVVLKLTEIASEISTLEDDRQNLLLELAREQESLVDTRIKRLRADLDQLVDIYHETFDEKYTNNPEVKAEIKKEREIAHQLREQQEESLKRVRKKVDEVLEIGIGEPSTAILFAFGLGAAAASGWFFSVFAHQIDLSKQNPLLFAITGVFGSARGIVGKYHSDLGAAVMVGILLLFLLLISLFVYICEHFLAEHSNDKSQYNLGYQKRDSNLSFKSRIQGSTLFSFWLQVAPILFFFGLFFIVVSLGKSDAATEDIEEWFSNQVIGTSLALINSAVAFLYILKVIEPRAERQKSENAKGSRLQSYLEIIIATAGFSLLSIFLMYGSHTTLEDEIFKKLSSLAGFLVCSNLCAIALGYAIRHRSLLHSLKKIEARISFLTNLARRLATEKPLDLVGREAQQFNHFYLEAQRNIFKLMADKISAYRNIRNLAPLRKQNAMPRWINKFIPNARGKHSWFPTLSSSITKGEAQAFPEFRHRIENLESRLEAKRSEQLRLANQLSEVESEKWPSILAAKQRISDLERFLQRLRTAQTRLKQKRIEKARDIESSSRNAETELRKGFHLGRWYVSMGLSTPTTPVQDITKPMLRLNP